MAYCKYQELKRKGLLTGTIKAAKAKAKDRKAASLVPPTLKLKDRLTARKIPVPVEDRQIMPIVLGHPDYRHKKNWRNPLPMTLKIPVRGWQVDVINCGRYSSRCTYTKWEYQAEVTSYAWIKPNGTLLYSFLDNAPVTLTPPRGYRWCRDKNGLRLAANRDDNVDYHPTSEDLLAGIKTIISKLRANEASRKEAKKLADTVKKDLLEAEKKGVQVCLQDALRAGNCRAGTLSFARRHNLDTRKHYKPSKLLKINDNSGRVRLAVALSIRRHRNEMQAGYCDLSYHMA